MRIAAWALVAFLGVSSPALADWRFTKWGMSPEEVKAAGGDQIVPWKKNKPLPLAIMGPYEVGGVKFDDVVFLFDNGKLSEVVMHTKIWNQDKLREALAASFGEAGYKDQSRIGTVPVTTDTFRDREKGNSVTLWCLGDCSVKYKPLDQGF